jgi:hypothetical protein
METVLKQQTSVVTSAYLVNGTAGNVGLPGAPIMHFSLVAVPSANSVSGTMEITQAINSVNRQIIVKNVTSVIRLVGYGKVTQIVAIEGSYYQSFPPPAIGSMEQKFSANLAIDNNWTGSGGFDYADNVS